MSATVVLGLAWGDEGKGRVCDALAKDADYVARCTGGNNAEHTVRVGKEEFKLHLVPSGIVREGVTCTIGNGVVVDPEVLSEEVQALEARGLDVRSRLKIDGLAGVDITGARRRGDLPEAARDFVEFVEAEVGIPLCMVSVGPEREQAIVEKLGV